MFFYYFTLKTTLLFQIKYGEEQFARRKAKIIRGKINPVQSIQNRTVINGNIGFRSFREMTIFEEMVGKIFLSM